MLQKDIIRELLDLKEEIINNCHVSENKIVIDIEYRARPHPCPECGYVTSIVHDYRRQHVRDISIHGKQTVLNYRKRRYRCPLCNKRFFERQSLVPRYHRLTNRLAYYLLTLLREKRSMTDIAKSQYVSTTKVINMLKLVEFEKPALLPRVLSIDEFKGNAGSRKFQCILTDPRHKRVIDILPGRESHYLIDYFKGFNNRNSVKFFVMDMTKPYLDIAKTFFPSATVIIDRFHFVRYNTWSFDRVRRRVQKSLSPSLRRYFKRSRKLLLCRMSALSEENKDAVGVMLGLAPALTDAYLLKEKFYAFADAKTFPEAEDKLKEFLIFAKQLQIPEYAPCITMLQNWREYILNSFKYSYSNGYTEGTNNKIKVIKRIAFGFRNFDHLRKRVLLASAQTG